MALKGRCTHSSVWNVAIGEHQVLLRGLPRIELFVGVFELLITSQEIPTRALASVSSTARWVRGGHLRIRALLVCFNVRIHLTELHAAFVDRTQPRRGRVANGWITRINGFLLPVKRCCRVNRHGVVRVRGDGGNTISPSASRQVLLALERCEIDFFVVAPLFLVSAGHPMSRGVNIEFRGGRNARRRIRRGSSAE